MTNNTPILQLDPVTQLVTVSDESPTISVLWDRAVQQAVINTAPGPTIGSRAYAMMHTAMFDAWSAYDPTAIATQLGDSLQVPAFLNQDEHKAQSMSHAAYKVLTELFPSETAIFDQLMADLGYDPDAVDSFSQGNQLVRLQYYFNSQIPAAIGQRSAEALLEFRRQDGSNQLGDDPNGTLGVPYSDISDYEPVNRSRLTLFIDRWTPEPVPIDAPVGEEERIQRFLTPHWGDVTPFALESGAQFRPPAPEPFFLPDAEVNSDNSFVGTIINPEFIAQTEKIVEVSAGLTDEQKLIAEFWEDPSGTSFPPGTWMTFGQFVSARDDHSLDDDAKLFFALSNAVFDAGIATWESKTFYDYVRPVRAVRSLGELGLIGEFDPVLGGYTIDAWGGPGKGTQTIPATDFLTYQTPGSDPSPPFAEYTSGHSAFSAAAAEVLQLFTGSDNFGAEVTFAPGESRFEPGITPQEPVTLAWETFSEAATEAGISRIYGGIHFDDGDLFGRDLGRLVGEAVFDQAQFYLSGGELN